MSIHPDLGGWGEPLSYFKPPEVLVVKKRVIVQEGMERAAALVEKATALFAKLPHLVEHVCATRYEDGAVRTTGSMLVKTLGTAWVIVLKEPDACVQMQVTAATLDDALTLADLLLGSDGAPWEPDPWAKSRKGQAKK